MRISDPAAMAEARASAGRRFRRILLGVILASIPAAYVMGEAAGEVGKINASCATWTGLNRSETVSAHSGRPH